MSAKKRLTILNSPDADDTSSNDIEIINDVKANMMKIIDIAILGKGLENLRKKSENINRLHTFVSYCLIHFKTSTNWQYNECSAVVSEVFTESDNVLCILLIENNAEDYAKMHRDQKKVIIKEAKPKYTKVECSNKKI